MNSSRRKKLEQQKQEFLPGVGRPALTLVQFRAVRAQQQQALFRSAKEPTSKDIRALVLARLHGFETRQRLRELARRAKS